MNRLEAKKILISARKDENDSSRLFGEAATETVLHRIEPTAVGRRREVEDAKRPDK